MICGYIYKKWLAIGLTIIGIFSLLFSILLERSLTADAHSLSMLAGMLTGIGGAFTIVGIIRFIYLSKQSPEKLRLNELQLKDERSIQITRISFTITALIALMLLLGMAFTFLILDYMFPAIISLCCLYVVMLSFFISRRYYNQKM